MMELSTIAWIVSHISPGKGCPPASMLELEVSEVLSLVPKQCHVAMVVPPPTPFRKYAVHFK